MLRRLTRLFVTALCTVLLLSLCATTAEARRGNRTGKVFAVTRVGQDWYNSRLKVKWRAVRGASYQMRWSYTPSKLPYSKLLWTGTSGGTYTTGTLDRGRAWYFQVRSIRSGRIGPWSAARALKFTNYWPGTPVASRASLPGAVQFKWGYTTSASRYRVRWSAAWYGQWPVSPTYVDNTYAGWVGQTARQSKFVVPSRPGAGDNFLAVDYANPVFAQVEANNAYRAGASARSKWVAAFPTPAAPAPGDALRMGNYNVMLFPTGSRAAVIARNISSHGVTLVSLQEANSATATAVRSSLGASWSIAASGTGAQQQILYRNDKVRLLSSGKFNVPNPKTPSSPIVTPWARFAQVNPVAGRSQNFYVVAVHFSEDSSKSRVYQNRDTGLAAKAAMAGIDYVNSGDEPVIVAGDIRYGREPYGDPAGYTPAQPTFVRGGYYDSMAAVTKVNTAYSTVNLVGGVPSSRQPANASGLGARSDHILTKGIRGSRLYVNAVNWSEGGYVPSDHNLIYADLLIPYL